MVCDELSNVRIKYKILEVLGSGSFGTVRKCALRETGELFACKTIKKEVVDDPKNLRREIDILRTVDHPNIIKFQDVYEDEKYIHLVTELCTGGELYDRVIEYAENGQGHFHEEDAALLISEIFDAIRYLHDKCHIVHRDLKPENFLLKDESEHAPIKIIDFGLSRKDDAPFGSTFVSFFLFLLLLTLLWLLLHFISCRYRRRLLLPFFAVSSGFLWLGSVMNSRVGTPVRYCSLIREDLKQCVAPSNLVSIQVELNLAHFDHEYILTDLMSHVLLSHRLVLRCA